MRIFGIDHAWGKPGTAALHRAGAKFVCRYLSHDSGKNLSRAEADQLTAAGIWIVVVWETTASRALSGRAGGVADAKTARSQATACGMPSSRPIYFAVDWDASSSQQKAINAYLDGVASVLGRDRVGLYGGYGPVNRAFDAGKIAYGWQTYAWSGGKWDKRAQLQQYSNGHTLNGVGVDYNHAVIADYGQWKVGVMPIPAPDMEDDVPGYVSIGMDKPQQIQPGQWTNLWWDHDYSDLEHQHADEGGPSILNGSCRYSLSAALTVAGVPAGDLVQVRTIEVERADTSKGEIGPVQDYVSTGDPTNLIYDLAADTVRADHRVRLQILHHAATPATISGASAKLLFWR